MNSLHWNTDIQRIPRMSRFASAPFIPDCQNSFSLSSVLGAIQ